ncbi:hypothetical protein ACFQ08_04055 [Streptosporangium algeriense]|uniref:Uncharacterized protein n=1 Tax=Streptosporangium algeriense TaxID=1682748 RepID=A0ABW3DJ01_9ACTN
MADLLSALFAVYVFIAILGGGAFLLKAAAMPSVTRYYFEHEMQDKFSPWVRFFMALAMMSVLWPLAATSIGIQKWWSPEAKRRKDS